MVTTLQRSIVLAVPVLLWTASVGSADEAESIKVIKAVGGRVTVGENFPGKPVIRVELEGAGLTEATLEAVSQLKSLRTLSLSASRNTDPALKGLTDLPDLALLDLSNTLVTDAGLKHVKELTNLRRLWLTETYITDAGLKEVGQLKGLQELWLDNSKVTDKGLKELKELKGLMGLRLSHTEVADDGLSALKELNLVSLNLCDTKVSDAGLKHLRGISTLKSLDVAQTQVTANGVKALKASLPQLSVTTSGGGSARRRPEQVTVESIKKAMLFAKSIVISYQLGGKDKSITLTDPAEIKSLLDAFRLSEYSQAWSGVRYNTIQFHDEAGKLMAEATLEGPTKLFVVSGRGVGIATLEDGKALDLINSLVSKKEDAKIDITKGK